MITYFDAVAIQPSAGGGYEIVVAGRIGPPSSGLVVRYTSGGQLDSTFATGGLFITTNAAEFVDVKLEADGSIALTGDAQYTNPNGQLRDEVAVAHLFANGSPDTTFGTAGTGISVIPPSDPINGDQAYALAIDASGRLDVVCTIAGQAALARFTAP
jgi:hypothetical protein